MENQKLLGLVEHVVVLMFENRSFDNVLGGLRKHGPEFDGVPPRWFNPNTKLSENVEAFEGSGSTLPNPDPQEKHCEMMAQIENGSMKGFVNNYAEVKSSKPDNAKNIMQYFSPDPKGSVPITSALANAYAVSDQYHGSGPVQTWPNRLFAHCGTPGANENRSYLNNTEYPHYPIMDGQMSLPSIFEMFDKARGAEQKNWKVYYDGEWPIASVVNYVYEHWKWFSYDEGNVFPLKSDTFPNFFSDIKNDSLPAYSFIEPRYTDLSLDPFKTHPANSNHPGSSWPIAGGPPIDIMFGEQLLKDVYEALAANKELFEKTLLIVTYDEHGGCFDHVTPPSAISPFDRPIYNFDYTMYGPRVPAIFINPYIQKGSVLRPENQPGKATVFDHTSIISSLREHFDLGGPLTPRDENAPTFKGLVDVSHGYNKGPGPLPAINLPSGETSCTLPDLSGRDDVDKDSLAYVMYSAVIEKRRLLKAEGAIKYYLWLAYRFIISLWK